MQNALFDVFSTSTCVPGVSPVCPWCVPGVSPVCPWCVPGVSPVCSGVSPVCPRCVGELTQRQKIKPSLFSSVPTSLKTGEQRS